MANDKLSPKVELLYLCNKDFKAKVDEIRNKYGMEGFEEDTVNWRNTFKFDQRMFQCDKLFKEYTKLIYDMAKEYGLDGSESDLEMIIESGIAPYADEQLKKASKRREIGSYRISSSYKYQTDHNFADHSLWLKIKIHGPITISGLKDWVDEKGGEIVGQVFDHYKGIIPAIAKLDKAERLKRIVELRNESKKNTFDKIADILCEENPDDQDVKDGKVNGTSVKKLYNRYTKS